MIAVCLKWVDLQPDISSAVAGGTPDVRFAGVSESDQAALEWALRCRDATGDDVLAITAGPPTAERILRDALAAGATHAARIDVALDAPSRLVAAALARRVAGAAVVWCGDYSFDRGTGSVPAFLAAELGCAQALGLVAVELREKGLFRATRRLDGGRREILDVTAPAVLSVEGSTAMLRRAPLRRLLTPASLEVVPGQPSAPRVATLSRPYRPRPRVLPAPVGATALDRVKALTAADAAPVHGDTVELSPADAAERIIAALRDWGYLAD